MIPENFVCTPDFDVIILPLVFAHHVILWTATIATSTRTSTTSMGYHSVYPNIFY